MFFGNAIRAQHAIKRIIKIDSRHVKKKNLDMKKINILCFIFLHLFAYSIYAADAACEKSKLWDGDKMPGKRGEQGYLETVKKNGDVLVESVPEAAWEFFKANGKSRSGLVIVCPGGGYSKLAYTYEGLEIAKFLTKNNVSAVILKYRIPNNPKGALQDIQRMIRLARSKAEEWNIDPNKIAVMGFSAGANLCARASTLYGEKTYEAIDSIDALSARPDATILIYPAYCDKPGNDFRWKNRAKKPVSVSREVDYALSEELKVDKNTPPAFIVQTQPDLNYINSSIAYYLALKSAGVPANLHLFDKGRHGFALRTGNLLVKAWPKLLIDWLKENNFIAKED